MKRRKFKIFPSELIKSNLEHISSRSVTSPRVEAKRTSATCVNRVDVSYTQDVNNIPTFEFESRLVAQKPNTSTVDRSKKEGSSNITADKIEPPAHKQPEVKNSPTT